MKVGLMLPQAPDDGDGGSWAEIEPLVRMADDGGADSLWVCDHFLDRTEPGREAGYHEPFTLLTAIAAVTTRLEMGPLVAATSFRSAGVLAKVAATLDSVARGRLILGLGCGWHEPEYRAFGFPFDHRVGRFEEIVHAVRGLLDGERVSSTGTWTSLEDAVILPKPPRRIPIVIAADGPRMLSLAARYADGWQAAWFGPPDDDFRAQRARLLEACDASGRTAPLEILVGVGATDDPEIHSRRLALDPSSIADGLDAWRVEGVDHVQLSVIPGTQTTFATVLEGIRRFKSYRR
jgi:alkanesulfonate monooxygenase SsuD/methylene tetrahydromethanopterin reductase-like flavin-dependent oxidoreductase (luciferase family)